FRVAEAARRSGSVYRNHRLTCTQIDLIPPRHLGSHRYGNVVDHGNRDEPVEDALGARPDEQPVQPARIKSKRIGPYGAGSYRAHAE
ncbi:hypothetical protein, partial [Mycobacterium lepromatosis]|uniref:hypothetical protein n=1 Tax=Mycobacterium lepromatosis TaxID=480418 RepID=UPI0005F76737